MKTDSAAMAINPSRANPFANMDNLMLADVLGNAHVEMERLKKGQDAARKEMTRRQLSSVESARFIVVKAVKKSLRFDSDAVKIEMGEDWYDDRRQAVESTTYTVVVKPTTTAPAIGVSVSPARDAAEALFKAKP